MAEINVVKKVQSVFSTEFLNAYYDSASVGRGVSVVWSILTMGGSVPMDVLETQYPQLKNELAEIDLLIKAGLLRWEGSSAGQDKPTVMLIISDKLGELLLKSGVEDLNFEKFKKVVLKNFGSSLGREYGVDKVSLPIASTLASVIESGSPSSPAFINTVLVSSGEKNNLGENSFRIYKDILEYYLNYSMGLVQFDRFKVNLTEKAQEVIKKDKDLWEIYSRGAAVPAPKKEEVKEELSAAEKIDIQETLEENKNKKK